jgi:hypothetical protein
VYGQAFALMERSRGNKYINDWTKKRLRALGLGGGAKAAKSQRG